MKEEEKEDCGRGSGGGIVKADRKDEEKDEGREE